MENAVENNIASLTDEQLEAAYHLRQKVRREKKETEQKAYLSMKNEAVDLMIARAKTTEDYIKNLHSTCFREIEGLRSVMQEYGDIRKNSKGGFSVMNEDSTKRVRYKFRNIGDYDERAELGIDKIQAFFDKTLKPTNPTMYDMMLKTLQRKEGKLEYSRVAELLSFKDKFEDEDWTRGCELLEESFVNTGSKYYIEFEQKDENGKWKMLNLNLSSL